MVTVNHQCWLGNFLLYICSQFPVAGEVAIPVTGGDKTTFSKGIYKQLQILLAVN